MIIRIDNKILLFRVSTIFISKSMLNVYYNYFDSTSIVHNITDTLIKWVSLNEAKLVVYKFYSFQNGKMLFYKERECCIPCHTWLVVMKWNCEIFLHYIEFINKRIYPSKNLPKRSTYISIIEQVIHTSLSYIVYNLNRTVKIFVY